MSAPKPTRDRTAARDRVHIPRLARLVIVLIRAVPPAVALASTTLAAALLAAGEPGPAGVAALAALLAVSVTLRAAFHGEL